MFLLKESHNFRMIGIQLLYCLRMRSIFSLSVAYSYFFSSQVRRSIVCGDQPRNRYFLVLVCCPVFCTTCNFMFVKNAKVFCRLDLYLPTNSDDLKPVVIFVTGGAWIIG